MDIREIEKRAPSSYEEEIAKVRSRYNDEELLTFKKDVEIAKDLYGLFYKSVGQPPAHPYIYDMMTDYVDEVLKMRSDSREE